MPRRGGAFWLMAMFATLGLLAGCTKSVSHETGAGIVELTPASKTRYTLFSSRIEHEVHIAIPASAVEKTELDVLLLFDRTGSMHSVIEKIGGTAQELVGDIQNITPKTRFAVGTLADYYPLYTKEVGDSPWQLVTPFQTDPAMIGQAINSIRLSDGGDLPEAYVRALWEASRLDWRGNATKLIVMFGDSTHHDPDPGSDGLLGTADDLTMQQALSALKSRGIHVAGIYCEPNSIAGIVGRWISNLFGAGSEAEQLYVGMWGEIAKQTDGMAVRLDDTDKLFPLVHAAIVQSILPQPIITEVALAPDERRSLSLVRADAVDLTEKVHPRFRLHIAIAPGTPAGAYVLPLRAVISVGSELVDLPFNVRVVTGWYNFPLWLVIPFFLSVILLALWLSKLLLQKQVDHYYNVLGHGPRRQANYDLAFRILRWLLWIVIILAMLGVLIYLFDGPVLSQWMFWRN